MVRQIHVTGEGEAHGFHQSDGLRLSPAAFFQTAHQSVRVKVVDIGRCRDVRGSLLFQGLVLGL